MTRYHFLSYHFLSYHLLSYHLLCHFPRPKTQVFPTILALAASHLLVTALLANAIFAPAAPVKVQETEQQFERQDQTQDLDQAATDVGQLGDDFLDLQGKIREIDKEINSLFVNLPVGFPRQQQAHLAKIEQLKVIQADFRKRLDQAAIASFKADPQKNLRAARHIGQMLVANLEGKAIGKSYDPARAMELAELLIENSDFDPQLHVIGYSAALAVQDFDRATEMLEKLAEIGQMMEPGLFKKLDDIKQKWESELEIRELESQANDLPIVRLEMPEGVIQIELFENQAPETVANFISLVEAGFYDGRRFFQVRPGQIARAGCPEDRGEGNPGYQIPKESVESPRNYFSGTLGMYHSGDGMAGSQFFVSYGPRVDFERNYVAFGRITEGLDVLFAFDRAEPQREQVSAPEKNQILKAEVVRKRDHEYQFKKLVAPILPTDNLRRPPATETGTGQAGVLDVAPPDKKNQ